MISLLKLLEMYGRGNRSSTTLGLYSWWKKRNTQKYFGRKQDLTELKLTEEIREMTAKEKNRI